jgi:hypothetical protein
MAKVLHQGALDGLCAVYAVVNAARLCGLEARPAFTRACGAVPNKVWPRLLVEGAYFRELKKMGAAAVSDPDRDEVFRVRAPFERRPPETNQSYWARFDELFDDERAVCAILGVEQPWMHWIVARKNGRRVLFADSTAGRLSYQKNRSSLYAGKRRSRKGQWKLNPSELLVFSRVD